MVAGRRRPGLASRTRFAMRREWNGPALQWEKNKQLHGAACQYPPAARKAGLLTICGVQRNGGTVAAKACLTNELKASGVLFG
jgi:hypothetical protein